LEGKRALAREISLTEHQRGHGRLLAYWHHAREFWGRFPESGAIFGFVFVVGFFIVATWAKSGWPPQILDLQSIASILTQASSLGITAVGVTILMISGEFDLSVGSILGLSALTFIIAMDSGVRGLVHIIPFVGSDLIDTLNIPAGGMGGVPAIGVGLATGALLGLINGLLLVTTRIPSFIVTLGTLYIYRSIMLNIIPGGTIARYGREPVIWSVNGVLLMALLVIIVLALLYLLWPTLHRRLVEVNVLAKPKRTGFADEAPEEPSEVTISALARLVLIVAVMLAVIVVAALIIYGYSDNIHSLKTPIKAPFFDIMNGKLAFVKQNFRSSIIWWMLTVAIFWVVLNHTRYGNAVFATGGNQEAARAQGVNARRVKVINFVISGSLAAVGGMMEAARFRVVEPLRGSGYELDAIAAVVIGGTLLTGGYGSIIGAAIGILITFTLKTGTVLIGIKAEWFRGVLGIIMILAVIINTNIRRQR
jgi:ribose/xylose/arabinose/galactoside ABC-type transport system permease subunit